MKTLVFIHGAGCTREIFASQLSTFARSVAVALPGHGVPGSASNVADFADAVATELHARDLRDVILSGFSMGGAIALELALRKDPRVVALALLGSGSRLRVAPALLDGLASDFENTARTIAAYLYADPTPARVDAALEMMNLVGPEQCVRDFRACNAFDVTDRLGEIDLPVCAITGELDKMMPPKYAQSLADRVPGASARILPGAGHLACLESPDVTNDALRAFVTQIS